jgi:hypothetical protein
MDDKTREWFRAQGRIGGRKRAAAMTREERRAQAREAARLRWYGRHRVKVAPARQTAPGWFEAWVDVWPPETNPRSPGLRLSGAGPTEAVAKARALRHVREWIKAQQPRKRKGSK